MGVDADELIIRPFKEVVERGNEACANAEAAGDEGDDVVESLAKAAKSLLREGERALKRLQPVWDSQVEKYGDAFKDAMLQQDDIEKKRRLLEDLLYDFEDYIEPDTFDGEKFAEVQAATRSFALDVINYTKRLKLESPKRDSTAVQLVAAASTRSSAFPPLPPLPPMPPNLRDDRRFTATPRSSILKTVHPRVTALTGSPEENDEDARLFEGIQGLRRGNTKSSTTTSSSRAVETLDRPPSELHERDGSHSGHVRRSSSPNTLGDGHEQPTNNATRATAKPNVGDMPLHSPVYPPRTSAWVRNHQVVRARSGGVHAKASRDTMATEYSSSTYDSSGVLSRLNSLTVDGSSSVFDHNPQSPVLTDSRTSFFSSAANSCYNSSPVMATPSDMPLRPPSESLIIPPPLPVPAPLPTPAMTPMTPASAPFTPPPNENPLPSPALQSVTSAPRQSIQDFIRFAPSPPVPPISLPLSPKALRVLGREPELEHDESGSDPEMGLPLHGSESRPSTDLQSVHLPSPSLPPAHSEHVDVDGLIPAEEAASGTCAASKAGTNNDMASTRQFAREPNCAIGPKSSFTRMGGFCKGAEAFRTGGHWKGIKQTGGYVANKQTVIGRCIGCGYGHNYEEVHLDMEKKPEATFTQAGVRFRVRFLYKSHISNNINSQRQAESHYACIFCVHTGATTQEDDATAFTTSDDLMLHLARHPQPLPIVPGVTVLYESADIQDAASSRAGSSAFGRDENDFDLHFVRPPLPSPLPDSIGQAAVATATKEHVQRYGAKKLLRPPGYTTGDMLQFLEGARIVGLMFPEKWEGKWCMGWHDGRVGAFSSKSVQIQPPQPGEIPMDVSSSGMSVTTRWRWKPNKDREKEKKDRKKKDADELDDGDSAVSVWLDFDKGETISNVTCLYADHWCWAGTNSKGHHGVFPQSHIVKRSLKQQLLPPAEVVDQEGETVGPLRSTAARTGWSRGLFNMGGSNSGSRRRPYSSSNASSYSSSTGRTRFT